MTARRLVALSAAWTGALVCAAVALPLASAPALAASVSAITPTIHQFNGGLASGSEPFAISRGPGNTLWFAERGSGGGVGQITLQGGISTFGTLNGDPVTAIADGAQAEGNVWYVEAAGSGGEVGTLNPATALVSEIPEPVNAKFGALTLGPEGDMWFTGERGTEALIWRYAPGSGSYVGEYGVPVTNSHPVALTFGPEGDLWFTENNSPGAIGRYDPRTGIFTEFKTNTANSSPTGITVGPEGDIWFAETTAGLNGAIGRINPLTEELQEFSSGITQGRPEYIVNGGDGTLYFTESNSLGAIGRITPDGQITEFKSGLSEKGEPWGITVGPDGNVWLTERSHPARIARMTLAPGVSGTGAEQLSANSATLTAGVLAKGQPTTDYFEYGTSTWYGSRTQSASAGEAPTVLEVAAGVSGLAAGTTYHFRVVATNPTGTTYSADSTFATPAEKSAGAGGAPPPTTLEALAPGVALGSAAGAAPASGTVLVENSAGRLVPLSGPQVLPLGTVIDATSGVVRLLTALPKHNTQTVTVWGGRFKLAQRKTEEGLTRIILTGNRPSCRKASGHRTSAHAAARTHKVKSRKLWAEDNHGRYSTYGANSVATVLGTEWETVDSCAGTLTRVLKGKVRVHDLHRHRTVTVRAGHRYLAVG